MMGTPKLSTFVIAMIWIGFFAFAFSSFIANISSNYGLDDTNINLTSFNKLEALNEDVEEWKEDALSFETKSGVLDIIGDFFNNGYKTLKTTAQSLDIFWELLNDAISMPSLNFPIMQQLKTAIVSTITIFIIIGVLLSAILKKDV